MLLAHGDMGHSLNAGSQQGKYHDPCQGGRLSYSSSDRHRGGVFNALLESQGGGHKDEKSRSRRGVVVKVEGIARAKGLPWHPSMSLDPDAYRTGTEPVHCGAVLAHGPLTFGVPAVSKR